MSDYSAEELDLEFDFWEKAKLETLIAQLSAKWGGRVPVPLQESDWKEIATAVGLTAAEGPQLQSAIEEEFDRELTPLQFSEGSHGFIGSTCTAESRLFCLFHGLSDIMYVYSHEVDPLWAADGINYKTVVIGPHNDLVAGLPSCLEFVTDSTDNVLLCSSSGSGWATVICLAHHMALDGPGHALEDSFVWLSTQRPSFETSELDAEMTQALEHHEMCLHLKQEGSPGKHKNAPGSPESPGKRVRAEVMEQIDDFSL